jgi:hypothetical protein
LNEASCSTRRQISGSGGLSGGKWWESEFNQSPPSSAEVKNEWSYPPLEMFSGVYNDNFSFIFLSQSCLCSQSSLSIFSNITVITATTDNKILKNHLATYADKKKLIQTTTNNTVPPRSYSKPEAAAAVDKLLMMGKRMLKTC